MPIHRQRALARPYNACMPGVLKILFLSIVALLGGVLSLALVSSVASWLPPLLGMPPDNNSAQLGWDLAFSVLGGIAGIAFATYYAPCWPRSHGFSIWSLVALGCGYAMWTAGADFRSGSSFRCWRRCRCNCWPAGGLAVVPRAMQVMPPL